VLGTNECTETMSWVRCQRAVKDTLHSKDTQQLSFPFPSFFPGTSPHRSYRLVLKAPEAPSIVTGAMPQYGQPQSILGHSGPEKNALGSMQAREKFGIISILNYTNFPRGWLKAVHYFHMMEYLLHGIKCGVQTPVAAAAAAAEV